MSDAESELVVFPFFPWANTAGDRTPPDSRSMMQGPALLAAVRVCEDGGQHLKSVQKYDIFCWKQFYNWYLCFYPKVKT